MTSTGQVKLHADPVIRVSILDGQCGWFSQNPAVPNAFATRIHNARNPKDNLLVLFHVDWNLEGKECRIPTAKSDSLLVGKNVHGDVLVEIQMEITGEAVQTIIQVRLETKNCFPFGRTFSAKLIFGNNSDL